MTSEINYYALNTHDMHTTVTGRSGKLY